MSTTTTQERIEMLAAHAAAAFEDGMEEMIKAEGLERELSDGMKRMLIAVFRRGVKGGLEVGIDIGRAGISK
jgi:hypothetical protein